MPVAPIIVALPIGDRPTSFAFYPTGGFGWVIGTNEVAPRGTSECILSVTAASDQKVDEMIERARRAGASAVTPPGRQPWGYVGTFADPDGHLWMATSVSA